MDLGRYLWRNSEVLLSEISIKVARSRLTGMLSRLILPRLEVVELSPESEELEELDFGSEPFFFDTTIATGMMMASKRRTASRHPIKIRFFLDQLDQNFQAGGPPRLSKLPSQLSSSFQ